MFGGGGGALGSLRVAYEAPDAIVAGTGAQVVAAAAAMPGGDPAVVRELTEDVLPLFAWSDGVASRLADAYRSGMCVNFVLAALAVMIGILYLPAGMKESKWGFAAAELLLLGGILALTAAGSRLGWHRRWFAMRRVAEYLRHAPALLLLGVARPTGRWPRVSGGAEWPEHFARHALRDVGLPQVAATRDYLRSGLERIVLPHVTAQRAYHIAKAHRLETVHHRLDKVAEGCFAIRYFADFERFGAISHVAAEKLRAIEERIGLLLSGAPEALTYAAAADLIHALDEAVVEEIASWQSVFGAKHLALPA